MTTTKIAFIAGFVALLVSGTIWGLAPAKVGTSNVTFGNTATNGSQAVLPNPTNYDYLVARLALGLGTNLSNSNTGVGNINIFAQKMAMVAATTTPCAIQNPTSSTTTAQFNINITTATSTASTLTIATSSTAFSTTTGGVIASPGVGANVQESISVDGSAASVNTIVSPNGWIVLGAAGVASGGFTYGGTCSAVFTTL